MAAFRASSERKRRRADPVGVGKPLGPSAAIRLWYEGELMSIVRPMLEDYRKSLTEAMETPEVERFFAQDDTTSAFKKVLNALNKKWESIFAGFAAQTSPSFVDKVDKQSKSSTFFSLSAAGVQEPRLTYNENIGQTLGSSVDFNSTLITGIQRDAHEQIYNAVMLSITSPNPEEQGTSGIQNALKKIGITSKDRVELITRDQTSKVYASLTTERMNQNGVEYFEWLHSSAGKVPRESHERMDGEVLEVNDPILWQTGGKYGLKKGDLGPPGWAINCRCRMRPLIGYVPGDKL